MSVLPTGAMVVYQKGNTTEDGDIVAGNQFKPTYNQILAPASPLAPLYERLRAERDDMPRMAQISEQLQHYCTATTDGDVRGLKEKLEASGREDLLLLATELKQSATKNLMKYQTSGVAQDILTHILAKLYIEFVLQVTPAVQEGANRREVDSLISEKVVNATFKMLGDNDLNLTSADLLGLLYYLGGNCHIRWDQC